MKQANLIIGSKEVIGTLSRTAAARVKGDGANYSHLMHEIGMPDEEGYGEQLQIARSDAVVIPMPTDMQAAHFKERYFTSTESSVGPTFTLFPLT